MEVLNNHCCENCTLTFVADCSVCVQCICYLRGPVFTGTDAMFVKNCYRLFVIQFLELRIFFVVLKLLGYFKVGANIVDSTTYFTEFIKLLTGYSIYFVKI